LRFLVARSYEVPELPSYAAASSSSSGHHRSSSSFSGGGGGGSDSVIAQTAPLTHVRNKSSPGGTPTVGSEKRKSSIGGVEAAHLESISSAFGIADDSLPTSLEGILEALRSSKADAVEASDDDKAIEVKDVHDLRKDVLALRRQISTLAASYEVSLRLRAFVRSCVCALVCVL
jgi:hypothetical protein